jgi:capsular exopolysaccharide synthesis family protein
MRVQPLLLRVSDSTPLLASQPEQPHAAEQYRIVRTRILQHPSGPSLLVVSSPSMGDGKTVTAVNLAAAFAMKSEEQILLIDADLRRSAVHSYLRVPRAPGLAEVLAGTCRPQDAIFRVGQIPSLHVLPAGEPAANPTELLGSSRWLALVNTVRQHFRRVIVDSPPVEVVADYDLIAAACDSVVLVIRPGCTNRTLCLRALEKTKTKLRGALINGAADGGLSKRYLSHYYSHSRQEEGKD